MRLALRPTISAEARSTADGATHATRQRTNGDGIDCGAGFAGPLLFRPAAHSKRRKSKGPPMVSVTERRKHARSKHPKGSVSRHAQRRVDERVSDVMARRDAAATSDATHTQISPSRRGARPALGP